MLILLSQKFRKSKPFNAVAKISVAIDAPKSPKKFY
jgi:hypothetical protein